MAPVTASETSDDACLSKSVNADNAQNEACSLHDDVVVDSSAEITQPAAANALPATIESDESNEYHPTHPETRT